MPVRQSQLAVMAGVVLLIALVLAGLDLRGSSGKAKATSGDEPSSLSAAQLPVISASLLTATPTAATEAPPEPTPLVTSTVPVTRTVTYRIEKRGPIKADLTEFATLAAETLADPRGWRAQGTAFKQVDSGGDFTLWLSTADAMSSFGGVCNFRWSCRSGRNVAINEARWTGASDTWNAAKGSLRDYRNMVVNHEVGHWLGHSHLMCPGAGKKAPVMQQQSKSLQGCTFNPWPLTSELRK